MSCSLTFHPYLGLAPPMTTKAPATEAKPLPKIPPKQPTGTARPLRTTPASPTSKASAPRKFPVDPDTNKVEETATKTEIPSQEGRTTCLFKIQIVKSSCTLVYNIQIYICFALHYIAFYGPFYLPQAPIMDTLLFPVLANPPPLHCTS